MTAQQEFWKWFTRHEEELYNLNPDRENEREAIFDQLLAELRKVDANLTFEFGPRETRRKFVISADGIKAAFPSVTLLVRNAPPLERWQLTAFRPRCAPLNAVNFQGRCVNPEEVECTLLENGKTAGLYLFIPGFRESDSALRAIGYLLLDEALGEYDVESRLGLIKVLPSDAKTEGDRYPLVELPALFDQLISRLEGRTTEPT